MTTSSTREHAPLSAIGPNWFASVMGTGILANAAITLPYPFPGLRVAATVVWLAASVWLVTVTLAFAGHWLRHREAARGHHADPVMAQFYGAPPMAVLTIGAGAGNFAPPVIGEPAAFGIAMGLWLVGSVAGLASAVAIPYLLFTRHGLSADAAGPGWLMPVVPPMVSAATGAALIPHLEPGQSRQTLLLACYAMFGLSLLATLVILPQVWSKLAHHGVGAAATVPTLWICLGPLGQSTTAAGNLGAVATDAVAAPLSTALDASAYVYGVPVLGFTLLWFAIATAVTIRTVRRGMPFTLTWWSFTFPVGTCVTAAAGLAARTDLTVLRLLTMALFGFLLTAWLVVAVRTGRGLLNGRLLAAGGAPPAAGPPPGPRVAVPSATPLAAAGGGRLPTPPPTPVSRRPTPRPPTARWSPRLRHPPTPRP